MTAPAAPRIRAHGNHGGDRIIVRWQPVATATDYNLYVDAGLEDQFADTEVNDDGWFHVYTTPLAGASTVTVTALNVGTEESVVSNAVQVNLRGPSPDFDPGTALSHVRRQSY